MELKNNTNNNEIRTRKWVLILNNLPYSKMLSIIKVLFDILLGDHIFKV